MNDYYTESEVEELTILLNKMRLDLERNEILKSGKMVITQNKAFFIYKTKERITQEGLEEQRAIRREFKRYNDLFYRSIALCPILLVYHDFEESVEVEFKLVPNDFLLAEKHLDTASLKWKEMQHENNGTIA